MEKKRVLSHRFKTVTHGGFQMKYRIFKTRKVIVIDKYILAPVCDSRIFKSNFILLTTKFGHCLWYQRFEIKPHELLYIADGIRYYDMALELKNKKK